MRNKLLLTILFSFCQFFLLTNPYAAVLTMAQCSAEEVPAECSCVHEEESTCCCYHPSTPEKTLPDLNISTQKQFTLENLNTDASFLYVTILLTKTPHFIPIHQLPSQNIQYGDNPWQQHYPPPPLIYKKNKSYLI